MERTHTLSLFRLFLVLYSVSLQSLRISMLLCLFEVIVSLQLFCVTLLSLCVSLQLYLLSF